MTIARAQMYRQLYQMGGIGTLPMDYGQSLQVPQQQQPSFSSAQNITMNPLLNYGQPQLGQAGGTPLTMAGGGMSRLGYQEGGMSMDQMMQPQMQDPMMQEQMMQSQMQQAPEGIMSMMPQGASGGHQGMPQEVGQEETALLTIIQLLIEQGVPPEQAQELAMQILQVFNQGGAPAVEEFANQLEQEEGMPENRTMMAGGGITGIYPRQGYFFKGVVKAVSGAVKGVAKAVKSVAKSPIGMIALSIAAPYAISAFAPGFATLGGSGILGGALRAGISNLAVQGILTGKINPKQALLAAAAGGAMAGFQGAGTVGQTTGITPEGINLDAAYGDMTSNLSSNLNQTGITPEGINLRAAYESPSITATGQTSAPTSILDKGITSIKDFGTNLMADPLKTIGNVGSSIYQTAKDNALPLATGFLAGSSLAQQPGESDDEYASRAARDANVAAYITQYGGGSKLYSPSFYSMEKAIDPFAGRTTFAATGGRIGYESGSMPMGEPRRNPAGIMELDYRKEGGFVPPVGIKEKADDIPAMLSNNEFVFTADAVRNAGGGNVDRGAQRMYSLMKNLESGGRV